MFHVKHGETLRAPFPWFGGKSRVAPLVWKRFGKVANYVEPFFGSGAVLLGRPGGAAGTETVNDKDGLVANFWRACALAPAETWEWADAPVNEVDLHARHLWCMDRLSDSFAERLMADPDFFDAQLAGWWVWGLSAWIGSGWCSGDGPWSNVDGVLSLGEGGGIIRQRPHLGDAGSGVHRKRSQLGSKGRGIVRQRPHLGNGGTGVHGAADENPLAALAARLRNVRVCCGDWSRVCGRSVTTAHGVTAVLLDPPYAVEDRDDLYRIEDYSIAHEVRAWCAENGANPELRIVLCGYAGEHDELETLGWEVVPWKARGGLGSASDGRGRANAERERLWISPHCLEDDKQASLFEEEQWT